MKSAFVKRSALIGLTALAALTGSSLASATSVDEYGVKHLVVKYSDLDLSRPEDAHRLYVRIRNAARQVCDNQPMSDLQRLAIYKNCMSQAVSAAVEHVRDTQPSQSLYASFGN